MPEGRTILVCCDTNCLAGGGGAVADALREEIRGLEGFAEVRAGVKRTGCHGLCEGGPVVRILPDDIAYYGVEPRDAQEIVRVTVCGGRPVERLLYRTGDGGSSLSHSDNPFYAGQRKVALGRVGTIDPLDIDDALGAEAWAGLRRALAMEPAAVIDEIERAGLRGRGGAGYPAGAKWRQCAACAAAPKYVVCNCDEGDPGAFMDRSIFEGDPHSVLEGLVIAAWAVGANEGFVYVRDEYARTIRHIDHAIREARERGFLGEDILGTGFAFDIRVVRGGGAFVCGESTALTASIEGRVGEPRAKYVRSVERGLWGQPTVLNNVETLANVPVILRRGADWFRSMGTEGSPGTKVFTLVGKVERTGLIEVEMGTTLRRIIFEIGGGMKKGRSFKAVQTGGPSGGCLPGSLLDLPVDFDTLTAYGSMMGSGGMIVMDDRTCMVEVARYYIGFLSEESCGKCVPCRDGLRMLLHILTDICRGRGREEDLDLMEMLCETLTETALCSLGKSAANPVLTTLAHFREEYLEHIREGRCRAGVCAALTAFSVDGEACRGCGLCRRACPAGAVAGEAKQPHSIDTARCVGCGACREACPFEAVAAVAAPERRSAHAR